MSVANFFPWRSCGVCPSHLMVDDERMMRFVHFYHMMMHRGDERERIMEWIDYMARMQIGSGSLGSARGKKR